MKKHIISIVLGFTIIMSLMLIVVLYSLSQNKLIQETLQKIDLQNQKASLLTKMSSAQLQRTVLLRNIYMLEDPFERDELKLVFYSYARNVGDAFIKLQNIQLSSYEAQELEEFIEPARANSVLQNTLIDKMIEYGDEIDKDELNKLFSKSFLLEKKAMKHLHGIQKTLDQQRRISVDRTIKSGEHAHIYIIILLIIAVIFSQITIFYVINLTTRQTKQIDDERMRFKILFSENMDAVILLCDEKIIAWNKQLEVFFNQPDTSNFMGNNIHQIFLSNPDNNEYSQAALEKKIRLAIAQGSIRFEWQFTEKNGNILYADIQLNHLVLNDCEMLQMTIHDITEIKMSGDALKQRTKELEELNVKYKALSESDPLTNIANRRAYEIRLTDNIAAAKRFNSFLTMLMIDIDFFKSYNDHYGHDAGDIALKPIKIS
jgi:PAS domain-containing protein